MIRAAVRGALCMAGLLLGLTGCVTAPPSDSASAPAERIAGPAARPAASPSDESLGLRRYYRKVQAGLLGQGLLRTETSAPDAPFSADQVSEAFIRTALYQEYSSVGGQMTARQSASTLKRWAAPVRYTVAFGGAIPADQQAADRRTVAHYANRLARVTGHPLRPAPQGDANFHVLILDEDTRQAIGPRLRQLIPGIGNEVVGTVQNLRRSFYCVAMAADAEDDGTYSTVVILIRAELPDLLRRMCIHEEMAQGLGLSNDSPKARPSIFNDDAEFAYLTRHDEILLRMLYDRRLRPGMTLAEADPVIRRLAAEAVGSSL